MRYYWSGRKKLPWQSPGKIYSIIPPNHGTYCSKLSGNSEVVFNPISRELLAKSQLQNRILTIRKHLHGAEKIVHSIWVHYVSISIMFCEVFDPSRWTSHANGRCSPAADHQINYARVGTATDLAFTSTQKHTLRGEKSPVQIFTNKCRSNRTELAIRGARLCIGMHSSNYQSPFCINCDHTSGTLQSKQWRCERPPPLPLSLLWVRTEDCFK